MTMLLAVLLAGVLLLAVKESECADDDLAELKRLAAQWRKEMSLWDAAQPVEFSFEGSGSGDGDGDDVDDVIDDIFSAQKGKEIITKRPYQYRVTNEGISIVSESTTTIAAATTTTTASTTTTTTTTTRRTTTTAPVDRFYDPVRGRYYPQRTSDCYNDDLTSKMRLQDYVYGATANDFLLCREIFLFDAEPMKPPKLPTYVPKKYADCGDADLLDRMDFRRTRFRVSSYLVPLDQKGRCILYIEEHKFMKPSYQPGKGNSSYVFIFSGVVVVIALLGLCRTCCKHRSAADARADVEAARQAVNAASAAGFDSEGRRTVAVNGQNYHYQDLGWYYAGSGYVDGTNMDAVAGATDLAPSYDEALAAKRAEMEQSGAIPPSPPPSYHAALQDEQVQENFQNYVEEEEEGEPNNLPRPEC